MDVRQAPNSQTIYPIRGEQKCGRLIAQLFLEKAEVLTKVSISWNQVRLFVRENVRCFYEAFMRNIFSQYVEVKLIGFHPNMCSVRLIFPNVFIKRFRSKCYSFKILDKYGKQTVSLKDSL